MPEQPDSPPERSAVQATRELESELLAVVIERHPQGLTEPELTAAMTEVANPPGRVEAITAAVADLLRVGLLDRDGDRILPTVAALRWGELQSWL